MIKFDKLDQFKAERAEASAKRKGLDQKRDDIRQELSQAKDNYRELVRRSIAEEVNLDAEIDAADKKVFDLERAIRRADQQSEIGATVYQTAIRSDDVAESWNKEFVPKYLDSTFNPAVDELAAAADAYRLAFQKVITAATELEDQRKDVLSELNDSKYTYTTARADISTAGSKFMSAVITERDLRNFESMRRSAAN